MAELVNAVTQAKIRAWSSWTNDGLSTIVSGFAVMMEGIAGVWSNHQRASWLPVVLIVAAPVILVDLAFTRKIVSWLKAYISYPRVGYVALPPVEQTISTPAQKRNLALILAGSGLIWAVFMCLEFINLQGYVIASFETIWAALMLFLMIRRRLDWYVPAPLLLGCVLLTFVPGRKDRLYIMLIQAGTQLILIGLSLLARFLREHPLPNR